VIRYPDRKGCMGVPYTASAVVWCDSDGVMGRYRGQGRNSLTHLIDAGIETCITSHSAEVGIRNRILSVGRHRNEHESE